MKGYIYVLHLKDNRYHPGVLALYIPHLQGPAPMGRMAVGGVAEVGGVVGVAVSGCEGEHHTTMTVSYALQLDPQNHTH